MCGEVDHRYRNYKDILSCFHLFRLLVCLRQEDFKESSTCEKISKLFKNFKKKFISLIGTFDERSVKFFGGVFEFNLVSSIRAFDFTVPVSITFLSDSSGNPVERSCVPWNPLVGGYFFFCFSV